MHMRIRHALLGVHVHATVFMGEGVGALGRCGTLVLRREEWAHLRRALEDYAEEHGCMGVDLIDETPPAVLPSRPG